MPEKKSSFVRSVLLANGFVDLTAALALFFPVTNIPLPGYTSYTKELAFVAGGWGIATLALGISRIIASTRPAFYRFTALAGLVEGSLLTLFCLVNVLFLQVTVLQASLPLAVGVIFGILYLITLISLAHTTKETLAKTL